MLPKILVIVGPTASGKSALAVKLAKVLALCGVESEIVSADSRQVYRGLNIGSGKITKREMQGVRHHMLDIASPRRVFSVAQYQELAYKVIDDILSRGKLPIVVGGTGQYIDAITKGLAVPEVPPNHRLRRRLEKLDVGRLFQILEHLDSSRSRVIDKHNPRRLVRAIEIATALGKVPKLESRPKYVSVVLGLKIENQKLKIRIAKRLNKRIRGGMVAEVRNLHKAGLSWQRMFDLGLEYRFISLYLRNKLTKQEMLAQLETAINQYAKRQMTWFKRDKNIKWLALSEVERVNPGPSLVPRIRSQLRAGARGVL